MGRAPSRASIKAARGVICAFARTREGTESRCAPRARRASARRPRRSGGCRRGRGAEASGRGAAVPWGCVAARTGEDTCERPKVTPGAHVRRAAAAGTTPARVPTSCCCPHLPDFAAVPGLSLSPGPSPNSGTRGESQGSARKSAAWGSGAVGGHGRQVHQVHPPLHRAEGAEEHGSG